MDFYLVRLTMLSFACNRAFMFYKECRLLCTHLLLSLCLHHTVSLACMYKGRQLVQKQAPCPPPQTQRWRNWTLSTSSSSSSTLNVSIDKQAGSFCSAAHPSPHALPPTHSFTLAQMFLTSSRGSSSLRYFLFFFKVKNTYTFFNTPEAYIFM